MSPPPTGPSLNGSDPAPFASGTTFDKEGHLRHQGHRRPRQTWTEETFVIDKTVDYEATTSDGKRIGGDATTSDDVTVTASEPATVTVIKDGEPYAYSFGDKLTEEGAYLITVEDAYGNKTSFTIVIDKTVAFGMDVADGGISNGPVSITAGEKETIVLTKDGKPVSYQSGQALTEEGAYQAVITDAYGNEKTVTFRIVSDSAKTSLDYTLGDGIKVVSVTKDGTPISADGNHLAFADDGTYVVTYEQGGKTYSFTLRLDTTAPEVTLNGVEDGGTVDGTVSIDGLTEEGTVQVYKDGVLIDYKLGDALKDYGELQGRRHRRPWQRPDLHLHPGVPDERLGDRPDRGRSPLRRRGRGRHRPEQEEGVQEVNPDALTTGPRQRGSARAGRTE
jgi:hypothetical protein